MRDTVLWVLLSASSAAATNLIEIESKTDGRTYLIDVDDANGFSA